MVQDVPSLTEANACIVAQGAPDKDGYRRKWFEGRSYRAHRLAYCKAHGVGIHTIVGMSVLHSCDNPACINPAHLHLGDHQANMDEKVARDRQTKGDLHGMAKLTAADVVNIRARYVPYCKVNGGKAIAKDYGVTQAAISILITGRSWKCLRS